MSRARSFAGKVNDAEFCELLGGISKVTLTRWRRLGTLTLPVTRYGGCCYTDRAAAEKFAKEKLNHTEESEVKYPTHDYKNDIDVIVQGHGSLVLLWPQNDAAKTWISEYVDVQQTWGNGIAVEPRYLSPIVEGMIDAGLVVA